MATGVKAAGFLALVRVLMVGFPLGGAVWQPIVGILAVRLMESLCASCERPVDPFEFLPPVARHRRPPAGSFAVSEGCPACRGSGFLLWQPVFDFLSRLPSEDPFHPHRPARDLRDDRASRGLNTLFLAGLLLFVITFIINTVAELVRQRLRERYSQL
jgi:type II secretory ATPase GspE/PulE/Tfp pilus assembly ATPase PilB-like protein